MEKTIFSMSGLREILQKIPDLRSPRVIVLKSRKSPKSNPGKRMAFRKMKTRATDRAKIAIDLIHHRPIEVLPLPTVNSAVSLMTVHAPINANKIKYRQKLQKEKLKFES
jgi:hypothetical protein